MTDIAQRIARGGILGVVLALAPAANAAQTVTQASRYTSEPITLGSGGYTLNFNVAWSCDDFPQPTTSAPGQIDLIDASGGLAGRIRATIAGGTALVQVDGAGTVSGTSASVIQLGAGGTPANAASERCRPFWALPGAAAGVPRGWPGRPPAPPPGISLSLPPSATAFQPAAISATATVPTNGNPLASVAIDMSLDGGATWTPIASDPRPSSPIDMESDSYSFIQAGNAMLRATATDTGGLQATSEKTLLVAKAGQPAISITPPAAAVAPGQAVAFTASGGATGNYVWSGSASGSGASDTVTFPSPGTYSVSAIDSGNGNFSASAAATATVTVQAPFYTLSVSATAGGTVAGGGSYPPNAQATAVATADPGSTFTGWTGDLTAVTLTLSVLMSSNKALLAHFAPLLPQTISFVPPGAVTTFTPAFTLLVTSSSGLPVSLALDSGPATLAASLVTPTGAAGEVTLTATQAGNAQYLPAQPLVISFPIGLPPPGVFLSDDSAATKRTDRETRTTSFRSGPDH